jgi:hypothetical protein
MDAERVARLTAGRQNQLEREQDALVDMAEPTFSRPERVLRGAGDSAVSDHPIMISVKQDEQLKFRLYCTKIGYTMPAGERLFRAKPYPEVKFVHDDYNSAVLDADKLQKYLDAYVKKPKKRQDELNWQ